MTTNLDQASAQIIQFPARGRFAVAAQLVESQAVDAAASRVARIAIGSAWYHDEAIEQAERDRKN